jgi:hypothetical protein
LRDLRGAFIDGGAEATIIPATRTSSARRSCSRTTFLVYEAMLEATRSVARTRARVA